MPRPEIESFGEELYARLSPLTYGDGEENGWLLLLLCGATGAMFQEAEDLRETDTHPPMGQVVDVDAAPEKWLPWLGQFVGVRPPEGIDEDEKRAWIKAADGRNRGKPSATRAAAQPHLTGLKRVTIIERDGGPGLYTVITYTSETPDPDAVERAISAPSVKPAGLKLTYRVDPGWTIGELEAEYAGQTLADAEGDFATVGDVESNLPI